MVKLPIPFIKVELLRNNLQHIWRISCSLHCPKYWHKSIHSWILPQRSPVVKSIVGNFPGIRRIRFDFPYGGVAKVLNQVWIDGTDKDSDIVGRVGDRLVIPASKYILWPLCSRPQGARWTWKGYLGKMKSEQHQMAFWLQYHLIVGQRWCVYLLKYQCDLTSYIISN